MMTPVIANDGWKVPEHTRGGRETEQWCQYSWQLQSSPTSSFWASRPYFPASSAYLLPADPSVQTVKVWTDEAAAAFKVFYECTGWQMFSLEEHLQ